MALNVASCSAFFPPEVKGKAFQMLQFTSYFSAEFKGQRKVLSAARTALDIEHYVTADSNISARIHCSHKFLGDIKCALKCVTFPLEIPSFYQKCHEVREEVCEISQKEEVWVLRDYVQVGTLCTGLCKKILSIVGCIVFKPVRLVGRLTDLGEVGRGFRLGWHFFALLKSVAKVVNCMGKLYLGCKRPPIKAGTFIFEIIDLTCVALRFARIYIHPLFAIILAICRCAFTAIEVWVKTT